MLVERLFPQSAVCQSREYMAVPSQAPHSFWNPSNLAKRGDSWKTASPRCFCTNLSIWHLLCRSCLGFQRSLSHSVKLDVSWKMVSPQCSFTEWSIGHFWHRPRKGFQGGLSQWNQMSVEGGFQNSAVSQSGVYRTMCLGPARVVKLF